MSEDCAVMPPTTTDHDIKSPSARRHSIDDILAKDEQMYSGSESSSESSASSPPSERDGSPSHPLEAHQTIITTQQDAAAVVAALQQQMIATEGEQ